MKLKNISPEIKTRAFCDSAPIFERELAVKAGIGWRGKQGQIINKDYGSCLLLGILFTDIELTPTKETTNLCNNCTACIDSCPTGALLPNGHVNATKCISYLTIEHKGEFGNDGTLIGKSLFGCDICTAVCPYNNQCKTMIPNDLKERPMPTPREILEMTKEDFKKKFTDTAIQRTGLKRLQRNAEQVIRNSK